jgi:hypothetical protein
MSFFNELMLFQYETDVYNKTTFDLFNIFQKE